MPGAHEVPVAVPQPGQHRGGVVHLSAGHLRRAPGRARIADLLPVQHHNSRPDRLAQPGNEQVSLDSVHGYLRIAGAGGLRDGLGRRAFVMMEPKWRPVHAKSQLSLLSHAGVQRWPFPPGI